jgi:hypothetical protein
VAAPVQKKERVSQTWMNGVLGEERARSKEKDRYPIADKMPEMREPLYVNPQSESGGTYYAHSWAVLIGQRAKRRSHDVHA